MNYFIVRTDDAEYTFYKKCNHIDYENEKYIICFEDDLKKGSTVLALIPHGRVKEIINVRE